MEARQQQIAELARNILPVIEEREGKNIALLISHHFMLLMLTALLAGAAVYYFHPITAAEERSLKILLEYKAQKQATPVSVVTKKLLDRFHVKRLDEIRTYEWNEAVTHAATHSD